jgi:hypothetical protein
MLLDNFQIFKDTTLFFSWGTPNLAMVIPAMDIIDSIIATMSEASQKFCLAICTALAIGSMTLNKYYNKTDNSEVYHISMGAFHLWLSASSLTALLLVLHPRHKLEYFKKNGWHDSWIEAAHDIVHEEFDRSYASMELALEGDDAEVSSEDDKVSPFYVLPSGLRASLTTLLIDRLYVF